MEKYFERHRQTSSPDLGGRVRELVELAGGANSPNAAIYESMMRTLVELVQNDVDRWDAKIANHALRDMANAFNRLRPFGRRRKVTVYGSARTPSTDPDYGLARELGQQLAAHGFMVITGAGGGIMHAAHEGAGAFDSVGLNIVLPHEQAANPVIRGDEKLVSFRFFFTRKLFFVKEADAIVLLPGGYGTQDEAFEVLTLVQTGKSPLVPIVLLDAPGSEYWSHWCDFVERQMLRPGRISPHDMNLVRRAHTAGEAIEEIERFYRRYHSARWVEDILRIRLCAPLSEAQLSQINAEYSDLCRDGGFEQRAAHPAESDEPELADLPRLCFRFKNRDFGRLRALVDALNALEPSGREEAPK
jgi:hypothetical protein